jgi:hypothetical protein
MVSSKPAGRHEPSGLKSILLVMVPLLILMLTIALLPLAQSVAAGPKPAKTLTLSTRHVWTVDQVSILIAELMTVRKLGLDPADYGLPALRGELIQVREVLGASGSRQLDALADISALALASDYRAGRFAAAINVAQTPQLRAPVNLVELHRALRSNRLRPWLHSLHPALMNLDTKAARSRA